MDFKISSETFIKIQKRIQCLADFKREVEQFLSQNTTKLLEILFSGSIKLDASDIHFEPQKKQLRIRLRIDGILQEVVKFDLSFYKPILSRLKLLSGMKLNITDTAQDGSFSILTPERIEIRASVLPSEYGESIVLRILNPKSLLEIEKLGLRQDLFQTLSREIKRPNGMLIVTGPTGSGKTTTLYAFLKKIQKPEIKIITIEDPIEYHLQGISQTEVAPDKGYDFANGLKSIMRQDPDVILVGEIRDLETAKIACQAALTGHFVLTTLHTNDAVGVVNRLKNLGVPLSSIAPAIKVAIAQRLVRKVCPKCVVFEKPSVQEIKKIKEGLKGVPKKILPPLFSVKKSTGLKIPKAKGCEYCNYTGYRGRVGIFESFLVDDEIEKFIFSSPSEAALRKLVIKKGMVTITQDGLIKVLKGETTLEELKRIVGPY